MSIVHSGGHTAEMLNLLRAMDLSRYSPRVYVAAATDSMSLKRAQVLEEERQQVLAPPLSTHCHTVFPLHKSNDLTFWSFPDARCISSGVPERLSQ